MIDFRLSSTDSDNLKGYIAKLKKKGFKVEEKTFEQESKVTKGRVFTYKGKFYTISVETIQELLNLIKIVGSSLVISSTSSTEVPYPDEIEIYDNWRE